nr:leucine-rich repeat protein [uncultured Ruminococcus sp.]
MKKLKVLSSAILVILVVFSSIYTAFAAVYIEDWGYRFEKINNGSAYEINKYIGDDTVVKIPNKYNGFKITSVGEYAFINTSVSSVTFGDNITQIKTGAFINVSDLSEVILNDNLSAIGSLAFAGCTGLSTLTIPSSVTNIADDAFVNCGDLVINCYTDSYAHQYAVEKSIPFVLLDAEPEGYLLGDTDNNEDVDVVDATWLQRYVALMDIGVIEDTVMQGDVDGDGDPTIVDATFIMRYAVGIDTPYSIGEFVSAD